nr:hypothetical protein L204_00558 [Cryptococcus depauperatus CBS 7855]
MASDAKDNSKDSAKKTSQTSSSSASKSSKPKSSAQIQEEEFNNLVSSTLSTHTPILLTPCTHISSLLDVPLLASVVLMLSAFLLLHLWTPLFALPHLSATLTLVCPIWATASTLHMEFGKHPSSPGVASRGNGAQWLLYWMVYIVLEWTRGWIGIYRPGCKGVFEVGRSAMLVTVGGGWFSRSALRRENQGANVVLRYHQKPVKSKQLLEAQKREYDEAKKARAQSESSNRNARSSNNANENQEQEKDKKKKEDDEKKKKKTEN